MKLLSATMDFANPHKVSFINFDLQMFADVEPNTDEPLEGDDLGLEDDIPGDDLDVDDVDLSDEELSAKQSKDKNHPANHAFAENRRIIKELKERNRELETKQAQIDQHYAELAKKAGREDIKTESDYRKAIAQEDLVAKYKETQDPLVLAELIKQSILPELQASAPKQVESTFDFEPELKEFNSEFGKSLKSIEEVVSLPNSSKIISYMDKNGLTLNEAFKLANPDAIKSATRQEAINRAKGHTHVKDTKQSADVSGHVSQSELETFMRRHGITDAVQAKKNIIENRKYFEE